ncbi:hypothetical protein WM40_14090 [Robbsia andropogonis]|uniref:Uncharacterized protein n=1 Tax=Robbsia andropogonis TaxID=28092 RepID=A0A0F5JYX8_9BURK|nr:hypothetical protein WM40_14090 [Robbsia andropogonis]
MWRKTVRVNLGKTAASPGGLHSKGWDRRQDLWERHAPVKVDGSTRERRVATASSPAFTALKGLRPAESAQYAN